MVRIIGILCFLAILTGGCIDTSDPIGVTDRTRIRNNADTAQEEIRADAQVAESEQERMAREAEAEQNQIARTNEANADERARTNEAQADRDARAAEANARVYIHNTWASVVIISLLGLISGGLIVAYLRSRREPQEPSQPEQTPVMIDGPTWKALEAEAASRGQRLELQGSTMLLMDNHTNAVISRRDITL